jgi:cell wall-associated NlpC family hydrolase
VGRTLQLSLRGDRAQAVLPRQSMYAMRFRRVPPIAVLAVLAAWTPAGFAADGGTAFRTPHELDGGALFPQPSAVASGGTTIPAGATSATGPTGASGPTGPTGPAPLTAALMQTVPGSTAEILPDGYAAAPAGAPPAVQQAIWAGNQLIGLPYIYGGGHASFIAAGYDCSGTVSYALHGGDLLSTTLDSTAFETWGLAGPGTWITVYTNPSHAFLEIAGIRLDTSTAGDPDGLPGPRWRPLLASTAGFLVRHPQGY